MALSVGVRGACAQPPATKSFGALEVEVDGQPVVEGDRFSAEGGWPEPPLFGRGNGGLRQFGQALEDADPLRDPVAVDPQLARATERLRRVPRSLLRLPWLAARVRLGAERRYIRTSIPEARGRGQDHMRTTTQHLKQQWRARQMCAAGSPRLADPAQDRSQSRPVHSDALLCIRQSTYTRSIQSRS